MGNAEISFGNNFLEIRYQREKEIPELHHLQMENGNWKMENGKFHCKYNGNGMKFFKLHFAQAVFALFKSVSIHVSFSVGNSGKPLFEMCWFYEHRPNSFSAIGTFGKIWHLRSCEFYMSICPSPYRKCQALSRLSPPFQSIICSYVQCSDELVSEDAFSWGLL